MRQQLGNKSSAQRSVALKRALSTHARLWLSGLAALAVSGALLGYFLSGSSSPALITGLVTTASISQALIAFGTIMPTKEVGLYFSDAGIVQSVTATPGEKVKAGQVLASLDTTPLEIQLAEAQANLASAQAKLENDEAGASPAEMASAQGAVASAENSLQQAPSAENSLQQAEASLPFTEQTQQTQLSEEQTTLKIDQQRLVEDEQTLSNNKAITRGWCETDPSFSECSQASLAAVKQSITSQQLQADAASVREATAQLQADEANLEGAVIKAPSSGTVAEVNLVRGENTPAGGFLAVAPRRPPRPAPHLPWNSLAPHSCSSSPAASQ